MGGKREHRLRWGLAVGTLAAVAAATVVAAGASGDGGRRPAPPSTAGPSSTARTTEVVAFYRDARLSLSHLLTHLGQQSQLFSALQAGAAVTPATAELVGTWANDYATARDLVGRLPAPAEARPARELYRLGAALYVESARTLAGGPAAADAGEEVRAARRLQMLADAVFDAGHRLVVPKTETGAVAVERPALGSGPDFAAAGVAPVQPEAPPPPPSRSAILEQVVQLAGETSAWLAGGPVVPGGNVTVAAALRSAAAAMDHNATPAELDPAIVLRLATLVEAEALRNAAASDGGRRLQLLAAGLWSVGRDLAASWNSGVAPAVPALPASGLDVRLLDAGGLFNGQPPPLRPGEPPDKDVPGGLPSLNAVLTG